VISFSLMPRIGALKTLLPGAGLSRNIDTQKVSAVADISDNTGFSVIYVRYRDVLVPKAKHRTVKQLINSMAKHRKRLL